MCQRDNLECSSNLNKIYYEIDRLHKKDSSTWKVLDNSEIFYKWLEQSTHLSEKHGYYQTGQRIFFTALYLVPIDIIMIVLFIMNYVYPIFPLSVLFYCSAKFLEKKYLKMRNKKFI